MKNILNVIGFEYKGFVSTKSFKAVTIIFVSAIIIAASVPQIINIFQSIGGGRGEAGGGGSGSKAALILSGEALTEEIYREAFTAEALAGISPTGVGPARWVDLSADPPDDATLSTSIKDGEYVFALRYSGGVECEFFMPGNRFLALAEIALLQDYITDVARRAQLDSMSPEARDAVAYIDSIQAVPTIVSIGGDAESNYWIGYVLIMFMFYIVMGYSNYVSSSIVTEKTSKAMELLITAVKPIHLMVGKVVGVGLAALTQVGALVAAFAIGIAVNLPYWISSGNVLLGLVQGGNVGPSIAGIFLMFFLLGFFLYAFLVAAFASTVTRPEEAATVVTLPMVLIMAALLLGFLTLLGFANKTLIATLSYIPFFTPINMLARYAIGDAGTAHLLVGAGIMAAAIVVVAILAAKIFRMGVMLYGVKATPKQLWKALKAS